jgi:hypothetical protein
MTALDLFAQEPLPTVTPHEIGSVLMAVAIILLVVERLKALFWPLHAPRSPIPRNEEYVKRAELDETKIKLENFVTRLELQRLEQQMINLAQDHKDLSKSTTAKYDEMCKSISDLRVTVEQVRREIHVETNAAADKVITRLLSQLHQTPQECEET